MLIIKGFLIGIGKIIPGVSGALIAISLGVYKESINKLCTLFCDFNNNVKYLMQLFIGLVFSIAVFSKVILFLITNYYTCTIFFFTGLILPNIKDIIKKCDLSKTLFFLIPFLIPFTFKYISINKIMNNMSVYFFIGILDSLTMIIPGISGTSLLMSLNLYNEYLSVFTSISINTIIFMLGLLVGTLSILKLINYLFDNYERTTYTMILGFSVSTLLMMLEKGISKLNTINIIYSVILFVVGIIIAKKINHKLMID